MKSTPQVTPQRPKHERQLFTWPGVPFCVLCIAPRVYVPMLRVQMNGMEHLAMLPEVPTFQTLDEATAYHQAQVQKAQAERAPQVWAPPNVGRLH